MSKKGLIVNRREIADICGVSLPTVDAYVRRGCPYVSRADHDNGIPWQFNTYQVIKWLKKDAGPALFSEALLAGLADLE